MRLRSDIGTIVKELERQKASKLDFCADSRTLRIVAKGKPLFLAPVIISGQINQTCEFIESAGIQLLPSAIEQLGQRVEPDILIKFIRELVELRPSIADRFLTELMHATGKRYFVRSLDQRIRAHPPQPRATSSPTPPSPTSSRIPSSPTSCVTTTPPATASPKPSPVRPRTSNPPTMPPPWRPWPAT